MRVSRLWALRRVIDIFSCLTEAAKLERFGGFCFVKTKRMLRVL